LIDLSSGYNSQLNIEKSRLDNKLGYTKTLVNTFHTFTRRVKGYTRFVGKYVIGRRKRFLPHKVYIFLTRITSRVRYTLYGVGNASCYLLHSHQYLSIVCRPHYPALKLRVGGVLQSRFAACMSPSPFCSLQLSNGHYTRYSRVKGYTRFVGKYVTGVKGRKSCFYTLTRRIKGYNTRYL